MYYLHVHSVSCIFSRLAYLLFPFYLLLKFLISRRIFLPILLNSFFLPSFSFLFFSFLFLVYCSTSPSPLLYSLTLYLFISQWLQQSLSSTTSTYPTKILYFNISLSVSPSSLFPYLSPFLIYLSPSSSLPTCRFYSCIGCFFQQTFLGNFIQVISGMSNFLSVLQTSQQSLQETDCFKSIQMEHKARQHVSFFQFQYQLANIKLFHRILGAEQNLLKQAGYS